MSYGNVYNPSPDPSTVVLEVAFNTDPDTAPGDVSVEISIGGTAVDPLPAFKVVENVRFFTFDFEYKCQFGVFL